MAGEIRGAAHPSEGGAPHQDVVTIAAVADIHCKANAAGAFQRLFGEIGSAADVLLLCGDLTDRGTPEEAHLLAKEINASLKIPVLAVMGNHDYESGHERDVFDILSTAGISMMDGDTLEIKGVGFAGVKGFGGGFGARMLQAWGEATIKHFVHEAVEEVLKLESELAQLRNVQHRIVLTHYAPIRATVVGESPEIFPFLGSSRLEEPLVSFEVTAAFHGHAHAGTPEGRTHNDIPVYNVAMPLLAKAYPNELPYRLFEVHTKPANGVADVATVGAGNEVRKDFEP